MVEAAGKDESDSMSRIKVNPAKKRPREPTGALGRESGNERPVVVSSRKR